MARLRHYHHDWHLLWSFFLPFCLFINPHLFLAVSFSGASNASYQFHHYEKVQIATTEAQELYKISKKSAIECAFSCTTIYSKCNWISYESSTDQCALGFVTSLFELFAGPNRKQVLVYEEWSALSKVPHIIGSNGQDVKDYSLDASVSPAYPHKPIAMKSLQGQTGVNWHNGFLICGGRISYSGFTATNQCVHRTIGDSTVQEFPMTFPRFLARMVIANGAPWITGGMNRNVSQTTITDSTEVLDPWQGWINGPPLPIPLFGHCLTPLDKNSDSTFFIHGGRTSHWAESGKVWFFHWNNQSWAPLSDLSYAASYHACAPLTMPDGTRIIVTAGGESEGNPLKSSTFFNVETHQWTSGPEFSSTRVLPGMANILGKVYVMGGAYTFSDSQGSSEGVVLNEDLTAWESFPELGPIHPPNYMYMIPYNL